jgi:hypothetical protein
VKVESRQLDGIAECERRSVRWRVGEKWRRNGYPLMAQKQAWEMSTVVVEDDRVSGSALGCAVAVAGADSEESACGVGVDKCFFLLLLRITSPGGRLWSGYGGSGRSRL